MSEQQLSHTALGFAFQRFFFIGIPMRATSTSQGRHVPIFATEWPFSDRRAGRAWLPNNPNSHVGVAMLG
jgi:hypothetical protein